MASTPHPGHVFISYRQQEPDKQFAHRLAYDLQAAGHPIWIDVEGIEPGSNWNTEIQQALDDCYAYVVILSPEALASQWVRSELLYALREKQGRIFPVLLLPVKLPPEIISIQYVDFTQDYRHALAELLANLPVPPDSGQSSTAVQSMRLPDPPPKRALPLGLIAAGAAIVLAALVGIGALINGSQQEVEVTPTSTQVIAEAPSLTPSITPSPTPTDTPEPTATLGGPQTPVEFVLYAAGSSAKVLEGSRLIASRLQDKTGIAVHADVETSYKTIVDSLCAGKIQLAVLDVIAYAYAHQQGCADVAAVALRGTSPHYVSEIIGLRSAGVTKVADLKGKTFCRLSLDSDSGWLIPKLLLKADGIDPDNDLTLIEKETHADIVRAVYSGECAGGGTFSDARLNVQGDLPDVVSKVAQLDTTIFIPNDEFAFHPSVPQPLRGTLIQALIDVSKQDDIARLLTELNSWTSLQPAQDGDFDPFREFFESTGYSYTDFVK